MTVVPVLEYEYERKNRDVAGSASTFIRGEYYLVRGTR